MPHGHAALPSRRFTVLLLSLVLYIVVYPLLPDAPANTVLLTFQTAIIFAGAWVLGQNAKLARVAIPLAVITLVMVWLAMLVPEKAIIVYTGQTLAGVFFVLTTVQLALYLAKARSANMATVLASLCGYLMIAIVYASAYDIVGEFVLAPFSSGMVDPATGDYVYFSIVTMTTLGYGDIAPIHPLTRSLATTEAVIGQFYVAVIVARLVSLVILQKDHGNK